jgi:hypothetical protein
MKYLIVALTSFPGTGANNEAGPSEAIRAPWANFANFLIKVGYKRNSLNSVLGDTLVQFDVRMTVIMEPVRSYKAVTEFFKYVVNIFYHIPESRAESSRDHTVIAPKAAIHQSMVRL